MSVQEKSANKEILAKLRENALYNKGVVDQWGTIHVGLFVILSTVPETWNNSFGSCNLDPRTRVPFP